MLNLGFAAPRRGSFGGKIVKVKVSGNFLRFYSSRNATTSDSRPVNQTA